MKRREFLKVTAATALSVGVPKVLVASNNKPEHDREIIVNGPCRVQLPAASVGGTFVVKNTNNTVIHCEGIQLKNAESLMFVSDGECWHLI